jgi:hypothetical protein
MVHGNNIDLPRASVVVDLPSTSVAVLDHLHPPDLAFDHGLEDGMLRVVQSLCVSSSSPIPRRSAIGKPPEVSPDLTGLLPN